LPSDQTEKLALLAEIRARIDRTLLPRAKGDEKAELEDLRPPDDLRALGFADVPRDLAWPFTEKDGTRGRLVLANTGLGVDMWNVASLERFAHAVRDLRFGDDVPIGGSAFVFSDMLAAMEHDGPRATIVAIAGALLVVMLAVGWGRHAFVTVACGALGTLGLLTVASIVGLKVNFLDFVALPITIGIGIDYSVNIASRARIEARSRAGGAFARTAVATTGAAVLVCSYTTVVGYASLLFSPNHGIRSFGLSAMIGELTCITTALVFAPAWIDALMRRDGARVSKEQAAKS
jgi:predicted RND superfamily exporter protein